MGDAPVDTARTRRRLGRVLPIADQLVWSAANVLMLVASARMLTAGDFGIVSAALLIILIALATSRSFVTEPLLLGSGVVDEAGERSRYSIRDVLGAAMAFGLPLALVAAVGFSIFLLAVPPVLLGWFFLACWANVIQDAVRFVALSTGRVGAALASDAAWLVCSVVFLVFSFGAPSVGVVAPLVAWMSGCGAGVVVGLVVLRAVPRLSRARDWLTSNLRFGLRLAADALAGVVAANVSFLLLGAISGTSELAGLRGAYVFLGPMNAVTEGFYLAFVPALARRTLRGSSIKPDIKRLGLVLTSAWVVFSVALLAVPHGWKQAVLGDTWDVAAPLLPRLLLASVLGAIGIAATYGVRAWRDARALVRARFVLVPCYLVLLPIAAWWNGALGYAAALIAIVVLQIFLYGRAFLGVESQRVSIV